VREGPDYEEGPHSKLHEEEFTDSVDTTLDKLEREEEAKLYLLSSNMETSER